MALVVKNPPNNAEDLRKAGWIIGSRRSLGEGNGSPLQYSSIGNPMDRGGWRATVQGVTNESDMTEHTRTTATPHKHYACAKSRWSMSVFCKGFQRKTKTQQSYRNEKFACYHWIGTWIGRTYTDLGKLRKRSFKRFD